MLPLGAGLTVAGLLCQVLLALEGPGPQLPPGLLELELEGPGSLFVLLDARPVLCLDPGLVPPHLLVALAQSSDLLLGPQVLLLLLPEFVDLEAECLDDAFLLQPLVPLNIHINHPSSTTNLA